FGTEGLLCPPDRLGVVASCERIGHILEVLVQIDPFKRLFRRGGLTFGRRIIVSTRGIIPLVSMREAIIIVPGVGLDVIVVVRVVIGVIRQAIVVVTVTAVLTSSRLVVRAPVVPAIRFVVGVPAAVKAGLAMQAAMAGKV
ncbi:MAG: hypothetical protein ACYTEQ_30715, partial [Planctomycetota bacterium]